MGDQAAGPITEEYRLRCTAEHGFATYTGRIAEWWDPRYTASPETLQSVTIEPRVGGRVYASHADSGEHDWGEVTVWEPGRRIVYTSTLAQDAQHPSEITVTFDDEDGSCTMHFAHGGWSEANLAARAKFGDWRVLLDRFAALAEATAPSSA